MIMKPLYPSRWDFRGLAFAGLLLALFSAPSLTNAQCDGNYLINEGISANWVDISATGTLVASGDDESSGPVSLGHIFTFYDVPYTTLYATSNGALSTTDDAGGDLSNDCPLPAFPSTGAGGRIYPLHDDLIADVYYQYFASTPVPHPGNNTPPMGASIFQWEAEHFGGCTNEVFQAVLFDNGDILFQYNESCEGGSGATVGVQNPASTSGETYVCDTPGSIVAGDAVIFYYSAPNDSPNPPSIACPVPGASGSYAEDGGVTFAWNDISGSGVLVASGDDASSVNSGIFAPVTLGAPFPFYGSSYNALVPTSNGYISTDPSDTGPDLSNDCPLPALPSTGGGGRIYYSNTPATRSGKIHRSTCQESRTGQSKNGATRDRARCGRNGTHHWSCLVNK